MNRKSDFLKSNEVNKSQEALQLFRNLKQRKMKFNGLDPLGMLHPQSQHSKQDLFLSEAPLFGSSDSESDNSFEKKINLQVKPEKSHRVTSDILSSDMESSKAKNDSFDGLQINKKELSGSEDCIFSKEMNQSIFSNEEDGDDPLCDIYAGIVYKKGWI